MSYVVVVVVVGCARFERTGLTYVEVRKKYYLAYCTDVKNLSSSLFLSESFFFERNEEKGK